MSRRSVPGGEKLLAQAHRREPQREDQDGKQGSAENVGAGANHWYLRRASAAAAEAVDDDRRLAFGDHGLGTWLAADDNRVFRRLDAVVETLVFAQHLVEVGFGGGGRGVGLDEVDRRVQIRVEDRGKDQGQRDPTHPIPTDATDAAPCGRLPSRRRAPPGPGSGSRCRPGAGCPTRSYAAERRIPPSSSRVGRMPAGGETGPCRPALPRFAAGGCTWPRGRSATGRRS